MDLLWFLNLIWWTACIYFLVCTVWLIRSDADLSLMWAERFGKPVESLAGKVVWITGASSGIGEELAYKLAKAGCKLILSARREQELERVQKHCVDLGKLSQNDILVLPLDQNNYASHHDKVKEVLEKFNQIDILVNNAGRSQRALIEDTELEVDKEIMMLNYIGVLSLTKQVLPHMIKRNKGHLVVTSSIAGKIGSPTSAAYCGTKHALQGWFDALRSELGTRPITITMVCPGPVFSNITEHAFTGKIGQTYGIGAFHDDTRMTGQRCAQLMSTAIANHLEEVWISKHPILFFTYMAQYCPTVTKFFAKRASKRIIKALKEGKHRFS